MNNIEPTTISHWVSYGRDNHLNAFADFTSLVREQSRHAAPKFYLRGPGVERLLTEEEVSECLKNLVFFPHQE